MARVAFTMNGSLLEADEGRMVLPVALENGIEVPHYCFHPGLSVAGNCRMCLVEIEGVPKLQTACSTPIRAGMVVRSDTERVRKAVRGVLEFLLINHPVDCPVCDQAGECGLQDYYMRVGLHETRYDEDKVTKPRKASPIGRWVNLDQERCILCARCVRFTREISQTADLAIYRRGDRCEVDILPGKSLAGRYTGNLVDVCPVGALTCRDFRFRCRAWYLEKTPSICAACARGCNIEIHTNPNRPHHGGGRRVMRIKPRCQPGVNGHWMCDDGRYGFAALEENRIEHALIRCTDKSEPAQDRGGASAQVPVRLSEAVELLVQWVHERNTGRMLYVLSPKASNEELYVVRRLFAERLRVSCLLPDHGMRSGDADGFLVCEDKNPNTRGAREVFSFLEDETISWEELLATVKNERVTMLLLDRADLPPEAVEELRLSGCRLVFAGTAHCAAAAAADIVLPLATHAEQEGSFTNVDGRVQRFRKALDPPGDAMPGWRLWGLLARKLGLARDHASVKEIFAELGQAVPFFAGGGEGG